MPNNLERSTTSKIRNFLKGHTESFWFLFSNASISIITHSMDKMLDDFFLDQYIFATTVYHIINTAAEFKMSSIIFQSILWSNLFDVLCTLVQSFSKLKMETSTTSKSLIRPLLTTVLPLLWLGRIGVGLSYGLMGPIQPYLARY